MEKYSKQEDNTFLESSSRMEMSEKQSEINAEFTKEEKTSPENIAKGKTKARENEETRLEECDSEKRMDESEHTEKNAGDKSSGKQTKGMENNYPFSRRPISAIFGVLSVLVKEF